MEKSIEEKSFVSLVSVLSPHPERRKSDANTDVKSAFFIQKVLEKGTKFGVLMQEKVLVAQRVLSPFSLAKIKNISNVLIFFSWGAGGEITNYKFQITNNGFKKLFFCIMSLEKGKTSY